MCRRVSARLVTVAAKQMGFEFVDASSYAKKIQTLRESYFPTSVNAQTELDTIVPGTEGQTMISEENTPMNKYVRALGKSLPK